VVTPTRNATTLTGPATLANGYFTVQVRNGSGGTPSGTWPLIVNIGASTPTISNMTTSPNLPVTGQQFNFTITGLNYNTSNAEVFFLGPGCSTTNSCVVTPTRNATTLTGPATLANGYFTVQVRNGSGGTPSGKWPLTVTGPTVPSLELLGIEVTQGIQDLRNDISLVQNKRTFVRVHVRSSSGTVYGVSGQLVGKRDNFLLPGSPLRPINSVGQVLENPERIQLNDGFLFELPDTWRSGNVELEFKSTNGGLICNDPDRDGQPNHDCRTQVVFETAPTLQVRFVGISYKENGTTYSPTVDEYRQIVTILKDLYPISNLDWDYAERSYDTRPSLEKVNSDLTWQRRFDNCWTVAGKGCKRIYYGVLVDPSGNTSYGGLADGIPSWVASGYFPRGPRGVDYNADSAHTPLIPPHEIAHTLGRHHAEFCKASALVKDIFGNLVYPSGYEQFPYPGGYISLLHQGEDRLLFGFSISSLQIEPPQRGELMSYCAPLWVSDWTYGKLLNAMRDRIGTNITSSKSLLAEQGKSLLAEQAQTYILIGGTIDFSANTGRLDPAYIINSDLQTEIPTSGLYKVRFVNSSGTILSDYNFEPNVGSEPNQQGHLLGTFNLALPYDPNTSQIVLMRNGVQLDSWAPGGNSPTVRVTSPNGGETLDGSNAIVTWFANSPTANALTYVVQYSADAGATWQTLVTNWDSTSYNVNLSSILGTTRGIIRVIASDGLHTAQDQSDTVFSVNRHLPQARIQTPQNSTLYVGDQTIILEGDGFDVDDGQLSDAAMSWSSNLDGALGSGHSLSVNASTLQEGTHTITLTVRDSDGQTNSASIPIQVSRTRPTLAASLSVSPSATSFSIGTGSIQAASQVLSIRNNGDGTLNWSATADQSWIRLSSTAGTAPANLSVTADSTGLQVGQYTGHITISTSDASNSPQFVTVTFNVAAAFVSGRVIDSVGNGISGVSLTLAGTQTDTVQTDGDGKYSFGSLSAGGNFTITPSKTNYTFNPPNQVFNNLIGNQVVNFSASTDTDLTLSTTAAPNPVVVNGNVSYTSTVTNNGSAAAPATYVSTFSSGVNLVSASASSGTCSLDSSPGFHLQIIDLPSSRLPDRFPSDIPVEDAGTPLLQNAILASGDGHFQGTRAFSTTKSLDDTLATYKNYFTSHNWSVTGNINTGTLTAFNASKDGLLMQVQVDGGVSLRTVFVHMFSTGFVCKLNALNSKAVWTVTTIATPTSPGTLNNLTNVFSSDIDPNLNNNSVSLNTTVSPSVSSPTVQLSQNSYTVNEGDGHATITVNRTDTTTMATVGYATSDPAGLTNCNVTGTGIASSRCDYVTSVGILRFAVGEASKTISIPIVDDNFTEGNETFTLTLSNPTGAILGSTTTATITITDNASTTSNPIDSVPFFVRQNYIDFLGREPDSFGNRGWQDMLNNCAAGDINCDRIEVSSRFFRSAEFQERGYYVYRFYSASFGRKPNYEEFIPDVAKVSGFLTDAEKEANKAAFADEFVQRADFKARFDSQTTPTAYVNALIASSGLLSHPSHDGWIAGLQNGSLTRAQVLRQLAESGELSDKYRVEAFVVMQYFGYLRRNPDKFYLDWIAIMNQDPLNYRNMVNGFMNSTEYRNRFAP
jgi:hypothetical protein